MSYENPKTVTYNLGFHDFGAGAGAMAIKPPPGCKRGNIVDIHLDVRETFTQVTTPGFVNIGTAGDADKFASLNCGAAAITDAYNLSNTPAEKPRVMDLDVEGISQVEVALVAPTGGTPAGQAYVSIVVDWF